MQSILIISFLLMSSYWCENCLTFSKSLTTIQILCHSELPAVLWITSNALWITCIIEKYPSLTIMWISCQYNFICNLLADLSNTCCSLWIIYLVMNYFQLCKLQAIHCELLATQRITYYSEFLATLYFPCHCELLATLWITFHSMWISWHCLRFTCNSLKCLPFIANCLSFMFVNYLQLCELLVSLWITCHSL